MVKTWVPAAPHLSKHPSSPPETTYGCAGTLQGAVRQISFAYSAMVRSEEKKPLPAVDMMDISVHRVWSWYVASTRACAPASRLGTCTCLWVLCTFA